MKLNDLLFEIDHKRDSLSRRVVGGYDVEINHRLTSRSSHRSCSFHHIEIDHEKHRVILVTDCGQEARFEER